MPESDVHPLRANIASQLWNLAEAVESLCLRVQPRYVFANERLIEVPFVFQHLPSSGRVLDVGCTTSAIALQLASLGYQVTGVDVQAYPFHHANLSFIQGDIASVSLAEGYFDCILLISVMEHVGLGHYGDSTQIRDRDFLARITRSLRHGGELIITVPFGKAYRCGWYRVYDAESLAALIAGYQLLHAQFAKRTSLLEWIPSTEAELSQVVSESIPMNGVALLHLRKS